MSRGPAGTLNTSDMTVNIIGAGCAGAGLARCLKQRGIGAKLFDRAKSPTANAYWISLYQPQYANFLKAAGIDESSFRTAVSANPISGRNGMQLQVHRGKLESFLREGLDVQWEAELQTVEQGADGKSQVLKFANGDALDTTFFVAADGEHSELRKCLTSKSELQVLPYVAYHGSRKVKPDYFEKIYKGSFQPNGSKWLEMKAGNNVKLKLEAIVDEERPTVLLRWTYSRPAKGEKDPLFRPTRDKKGAKDIPPELFEEMKGLGKLAPPFDDAFDPEKIGNDRVLHWLQRKCLLDPRDRESLATRSIALIGQAAHTEPIIGGLGANRALEDAVSLAEHISAHGQGGLSVFYDEAAIRWEDGVIRAEEALDLVHRTEHDESRL